MSKFIGFKINNYCSSVSFVFSVFEIAFQDASLEIVDVVAIYIEMQ